MSLAITDVEALDWSNFRAAAYVTEHGDAETFETLPAWQRRIEHHSGVVGAHRGGNYDFLFLGPLDRVREDPNSGGIAKARYGRAMLWDTYSLIPASAEKIGAAVGLRKFKGRSDAIGDLPLRKVKEHAIRDSQIVLRGVLQHREAMLRLSPKPPPSTAGGTALRVFEALEPEAVAELARNALTADEWLDQRFAFSGDRSEVWWIGSRPRVWVYDINSAFPFSWIQSPVPAGPWRKVTREEPGAPFAVYWCDPIRQNRRRLPIVQAGGRWAHDGSGYATSEELAALREAGGSATVVHGWVSDSVVAMGAKTVAWLYERKLAGVPWAKGALVALHGKTIQQITGRSAVRTATGYREERVLAWPQWFQVPLLGMCLYSRPRLRLVRTAQALLDAGREIYFCKADSLQTNCPPEDFPDVIGEACGDYKVEAADVEGIYCSHGLYGLRDRAGKVKIASTGINPAALDWTQLETIAAGRDVVAEFRGGLEGWRKRAQTFGPQVATRRLSLRIHTGGKVGKSGRLSYPKAAS